MWTMPPLFENRCCNHCPVTKPFHNESIYPAFTEIRDTKKQCSDQMSAPGSLCNHHNVCPQALLSLGLPVCLFVCQSQVLFRTKSPISPHKNPGTINKKMKDRLVNARRCFERIKRLATDGFAQWHGTFLSLIITLLPQLVHEKKSHHQRENIHTVRLTLLITTQINLFI